MCHTTNTFILKFIKFTFIGVAIDYLASDLRTASSQEHTLKLAAIQELECSKTMKQVILEWSLINGAVKHGHHSMMSLPLFPLAFVV